MFRFTGTLMNNEVASNETRILWFVMLSFVINSWKCHMHFYETTLSSYNLIFIEFTKYFDKWCVGL